MVMARPLASFARPAGYGYDRKRESEQPMPAPARPQPSQPDMAPPARRLPAGQLPDEVKTDIIDQNRTKRNAAFEKQQSGYAQADRNMAAIREGQLVQSRAKSTSAGREALLTANRPNPAAARPAVPVVRPAPPPMPSVAPSPTAAGTPPTAAPAPLPTMNTGAPSRGDMMNRPAPTPQAAVAPAASQISPFDTSTTGSVNPDPQAIPGFASAPQAAVAPTQAEMGDAKTSLDAALPNSPENIARRAASNSGMTGDVDRSTTDMQGRMDAINRVNTGQATALYGNRTSPGGVAGVQGGGMEVYNNRPAQPQQRPAVAPFTPTDYTSRPVIAGPDGTSASHRLQLIAQPNSRLETLNKEAQRGQAALDSGSSIEKQERASDLAASRKQEVDLAKAQNPAREAGTSSQPKPALDPERKVQLDNATLKYNNAFDAYYAGSDKEKPALKEKLEKADGELQDIVNNPPKKDMPGNSSQPPSAGQRAASAARASGGPAATAPAATAPAPTAPAVNQTATIGKMKNGVDVTEQNISHTMKTHNMTREQVIAEISKRGYTANAQ